MRRDDPKCDSCCRDDAGCWPSECRRRAIAASSADASQDASGAVVAGAAVTAVNEATNETRTIAEQRVGGVRARRARARYLARRDRCAWTQDARAACRARGESGAARRRAAAGRRADRSRRSGGADGRCAARFTRRRHRRREPPDPRHAARRPQFSRAHAARAGRRARGAGIGRIGARRFFVQRQRRTRRFQQLSARRRRQHRSEAEHDGRPAAGRRDSGIRSAHEHARSRASAARRRRKSAWS